MRRIKANLKNVVRAFAHGCEINGQPSESIYSDHIIPDEIYFLNRVDYDNGQIGTQRCDNSMPRGMFNDLTRNEVKKYLAHYSHHYIIW